jgi:hypothetical protein
MSVLLASLPAPSCIRSLPCLPAALSLAPQLRHLDVSMGRLTELPAAVARLPCLGTLLAMDNELSGMPEGPYPALEKLDLRYSVLR